MLENLRNTLEEHAIWPSAILFTSAVTMVCVPHLDDAIAVQNALPEMKHIDTVRCGNELHVRYSVV